MILDYGNLKLSPLTRTQSRPNPLTTQGAYWASGIRVLGLPDPELRQRDRQPLLRPGFGGKGGEYSRPDIRVFTSGSYGAGSRHHHHHHHHRTITVDPFGIVNFNDKDGKTMVRGILTRASRRSGRANCGSYCCTLYKDKYQSKSSQHQQRR